MTKKNKKKNKKLTEEVKEGTILLFQEPISDEKFAEMKVLFESIPSRYDVLITPDMAIHLDETYLGPCPWCQKEIYTRDVCPECGKFVDLR